MTDQQARFDIDADTIARTPGSHIVATGIGAASGAAAGAIIGSLTGPVGSAIGGVLGALAGGFAGKDVGESAHPTFEPGPVVMVIPPSDQPVNPVAEDLYWQRAFITEPYYDQAMTYDDYAPAYRTGIAQRLGDDGQRRWNECESDLQALWEHRKGLSRLSWEQAREALRAAWNRVDHALA